MNDGWSTQVEGSKGNKYTVVYFPEDTKLKDGSRITEEMKYSCTCPQFTFRKLICKHIKPFMDGTKEHPKVDSPIKVMCTDCQEFMSESKVEFLNIEEDLFGRDRLTFNCPYCKTKQVSLRFG